MTTQVFFAKKPQYALTLLQRCLGEKGVWADPVRYKDTCWTRDTACAILPAALMLKQSNVPLGSELYARLLTFADHLFARQRPDGSLPILILDNEARWVAAKEQQERDRGREPFMLKRYREGEVENLTPGTHDSEIWAIMMVAMLDDASLTARLLPAMMRAMDFVLVNYFENGLLVGADWRDTMHEEFLHTPLLTNNATCLRALRALAELAYKRSKMRSVPAGAQFPHERYARQAIKLERRIRETFVRDGRLIDFPTDDSVKLRFDPLGASYLALSAQAGPDPLDLVHDRFEKELMETIFDAVASVDSPCGVTIKCKHKPYRDGEQEVIDRTDGVVVWPFVVGYTCWAFSRHRATWRIAQEQYTKLGNHEGFAEYHDPQTGKGWGAHEQCVGGS